MRTLDHKRAASAINRDRSELLVNMIINETITYTGRLWHCITRSRARF